MHPVPTALLQLYRSDHQLLRKGARRDHPPRNAKVLSLLANQLLHPEQPGGYLVRSGRLRVSQLLDDGREITRAVLHGGSAFAVLDGQSGDADPVLDIYPLERLILMALSETGIWLLPPDTLTTGRR